MKNLSKTFLCLFLLVFITIQNCSAEEKYVTGSGQLLTIDTRNQEVCFEIRKILLDRTPNNHQLEYMCELSHDTPYVSVIATEVDDQITIKKKLTFDNFTPENRKLALETRNIMVMGLGVMGLLYLMPESVTKWDKEQANMKNLGEKYSDNVTSGPVMDKDDWAINYIGHAYFGAVYYVIARHAGCGRLKSFLYSAAMSTFFWEYGVEAFAEVPSIQDLIITPVLGSLLGEAFIMLEDRIEKNEGKLFNSKKIGSITKVFMDPARGISRQINKLFDKKIIKDSNIFLTGRYGDQSRWEDTGVKENSISVMWEFYF